MSSSTTSPPTPRFYYASPMNILIAKDADEKAVDELYNYTMSALKSVVGNRVLQRYALEIKTISQMAVYLLPFVSGNASVGQSYVNTTLLQSVIIKSRAYLRRPSAISYATLAIALSLVAYMKANTRQAVSALRSEIENLLGVNLERLPQETCLSHRWLSTLRDTITTRIGSSSADVWNALIRLTGDVHRALFLFDTKYMFVVYRLLQIRHVTTTAPKYSRSVKILAWILTFRLSIQAASFLAHWLRTYCYSNPSTAESTCTEPSSSSQNTPSPSNPNAPKCPLCMVPISLPAVTPCGHVYCWDCIIQHVQTHHQSLRQRSSSCPVCRTPLSGPQIRPMHGYI